MCFILAFGVKLVATLVALILITSWKVEGLHMHKRTRLLVGDLPTQIALKLANVFSFSDFAVVSMQVLSDSLSISPLQSIILHLVVLETFRVSIILLVHHFKNRGCIYVLYETFLLFHFDKYSLTCAVIVRGGELLHYL